jgi:Putative Ig domain
MYAPFDRQRLPHCRFRRTPQLERLEDRTLLSPYNFTKIVDSTDGFAGLYGGLSLNDQGTIAFYSEQSSAVGYGIYLAKGGQINLVATASSVGQTGLEIPSIDSSGNVYSVALSVGYFASGLQIITGGVYRWGGGGNAQRLLPFGDSFGDINGPYITSSTLSVNASGSVSFIGAYVNDVEDSGYGFSQPVILRLDGGSFAGIAETNNQLAASPFDYFYTDPVINSAGEIAFGAVLHPSYQGQRSIVVASGPGSFTTVATSNESPSDSLFFPAAINDDGTVLIESSDPTQGYQIYKAGGGRLIDVVDTSGGFGELYSPEMNNAGTVVFKATLDTGQDGIFTGRDPIADKVIESGDTLFGKQVQSSGRFQNSLAINNSGQIAFSVEFTDGTWGIYLATPRRPLLLLPGIAGSFPTDSGFHDWLLNRGAPPDSLRIDPLGGVYDNLIQTLKNAGYQDCGPDQDLFIATYDWRMPPAPAFDGQADGMIGGFSATSLIQDVADNKYYSGVDYLGYWLKKAVDTWAAEHPDAQPLDSVDVIAHSTGGLIVRSYVQSAAYNGVYGQDPQGDDLRLPKIDDFLMLDVPNEGASKAWNPLNDNFATGNTFLDRFTYEHVLAAIIEAAYTKLEFGFTIQGPDGTISLADIRNPDGSEDKAKFIALYVPTINSLLATYDFTTNFTVEPDEENTLVLDLNAGAGLTTFLDSVGKVFDLYGNDVVTPQTVTKLAGDGSAGSVFSFTDGFAHAPTVGETYYQDNQDYNGDGTVPLKSLVGPFANDSRVVFQPFIKGLQTSADVDHTKIVSNPDTQKKILEDLGLTVDATMISTSLGFGIGNFVNVVTARFDPVEGLLVDGEGRRLGYGSSTGSLTEIPNSIYLGQADGIGYIFGLVSGPLTLDLVGLGGEYSVRVSGQQGDTAADLSESGILAAGEQKEFDVMFAPISAGISKPPTLAPIGDQTVAEGSSLTVRTMAFDPDAGQILRFSLDPGAPDGAKIDPTTGVFRWTPSSGPATIRVTVRVTDSGTPPLSDTKTFTITVTAPPQPVILSKVQAKTNKKHLVTEILVTFSGAVNAAEAENLKGIYRLATPGKKGSYVAKNAGSIKLRSAIYAQATNTVALIPKKPFALTKKVQLEVIGLGPSGLHDSIGRLIDGDHNGTVGGNAIAILSKRGATVSAVKAARTSGRSK